LLITVLYVLFACIAAVQLAACFALNERLRVATKVFIVPLLAAIYAVGRETFFPTVIAACTFGWLGDIFLIRKTKPRQFLGLVSFLLGHAAYIVTFFIITANVNFSALIVEIAAAGFVVFFAMKAIKPNKKMQIPMTAYSIIISLMGVAAFQTALVRGGLGGALIFAGSMFFQFSDFYLGYYTFRTHTRRHQFVVMLPYMAAQFCLIYGIMQF
jgi:uncharacterized membrane protein YhhN